MIKKVHINMCPTLDGYGVMTVFSFPYTPSCEPRLSSGGSLFSQLQTERSRYLDTGGYLRLAGKGVLPARFTTEWQPLLRPEVAFSKISFKHR